MSNMSYCRFENTFSDLEDCYENMEDNDLSESEQKYMDKTIDMCVEIAINYGHTIDREVVEE